MEKINEFTQSQGHGLFWDSEIRECVFGLSPCKNDTKKYDIDSIENKFNSNENVSIKTSSDNGFGCGDILRFYNGDFTKKYTIILIRYKQQGLSKEVKEVIELDYTEDLRNSLFGDVDQSILEEYVNMIKSIPPGRVSQDVKLKYKNLKKEIQKDKNMIININPKVDSKSQRRVQCSISNLDSIIEKHPECLISRNNEPVLRGFTITGKIVSSPRKRNKKLK